MSLAITQIIIETLFAGLIGIDLLSSTNDSWTIRIAIVFVSNFVTRVANLVIAGSLHSGIKSSLNAEVIEVTEL